MDEARKDEIGHKFLLNHEIDEEQCGRLEIQELIFLIHSAKHFKEKQAFQREHLDSRISLFVNLLKERIKDTEALYLAYDKQTNYPYCDAEDRIWMSFEGRVCFKRGRLFYAAIPSA